MIPRKLRSRATLKYQCSVFTDVSMVKCLHIAWGNLVKTNDYYKFESLRWIAEPQGAAISSAVFGESSRSLFFSHPPPCWVTKCNKKGLCSSDIPGVLNTRWLFLSPFFPRDFLTARKIDALQLGLLALCHWQYHTHFSLSGWTVARSRLKVC